MFDPKSKSLTIVREFDAPRELVWKAWTTPEMVTKWWGPKDFTSPAAHIDFRVGGKVHSAMRGPDGKVYWSIGTYKEIVPMEKIVVTDSFSDEKGNVVSSEQYGMKGFPLELLVTIMFEDVGSKTKMTLVHSGLDKVDEKIVTDMNLSWNQSFDKMVSVLK